jgi:hypothetical protein
MDISKLSDSELADFTANLVTLLGGTELASIDSHVRSELVAAFGTKPADMATQTAAASAIDNEKQSAFSTKGFTRDELIVLSRQTRDFLKAGLAPKKEFDLAGFDFPQPGVHVYIAQTPTDMAAVGFSNGINTGRFKGNNRPGAVVYEIWRREGDTGAWHTHILTKKQSFRDEGVIPGQFYEYRVRARATQTDSDFSNSTVVYGAL